MYYHNTVSTVFLTVIAPSQTRHFAKKHQMSVHQYWSDMTPPYNSSTPYVKLLPDSSEPGIETKLESKIFAHSAPEPVKPETSRKHVIYVF